MDPGRNSSWLTSFADDSHGVGGVFQYAFKSGGGGGLVTSSEAEARTRLGYYLDPTQGVVLLRRGVALWQRHAWAAGAS